MFDINIFLKFLLHNKISSECRLFRMVMSLLKLSVNSLLARVESLTSLLGVRRIHCLIRKQIEEIKRK